MLFRSETQLKLILGEDHHYSPCTSHWGALDTLYIRVLKQAISTNVSNYRLGQLRELIGAILAAEDPLSACSLANLLSIRSTNQILPGDIVRERLSKLHAVLDVPEHERIRAIHPSFKDFLTERCTDARFRVDLTMNHQNLALACLRRMQGCLQRDICRVGHGPIMNADINNLDARVAEYIPDDLQYACRFWAHHVGKSATDSQLYESVRTSIFDHLLHWFEVLSLVNEFDRGIVSLKLARDWVKVKFFTHHETLTDSIPMVSFLTNIRPTTI